MKKEALLVSAVIIKFRAERKDLKKFDEVKIYGKRQNKDRVTGAPHLGWRLGGTGRSSGLGEARGICKLVKS